MLVSFVVDEAHDIWNIRVGPWKFIGQMKDDRPNHRFWTVAMSGTMTNSDPTDIQAVTDLTGSSAWSNETHPDNSLSPSSLKGMKKAIDKNLDTANLHLCRRQSGRSHMTHITSKSVPLHEGGMVLLRFLQEP